MDYTVYVSVRSKEPHHADAIVMGDPDAHSVLEVMGKDVVHAKNMAKGSDRFQFPTPICKVHSHM